MAETKREDYPIRSHMDDPDIKWRDGKKPDFSVVNKKFMAGKTMNHKAGSLEKIAEDLVKTWEMESTHKMDAKDWRTIDTEKYTFRVNMGRRHDIQSNIINGNYNMMLEGSPIYDVTKETNDSSLLKFKRAFPDGFPWELLEVLCGPPKVTFTWRHWGTWSGHLNQEPPTGETLEMCGMCIAEVDDKLRITDLQVFFDPHPMLGKMMGHAPDKCPFTNKGQIENNSH